MAKNFLFEPFTDCVKINEVYFMQRRKIFDPTTEFSQLLRGKRRGSRDGDINVGMGASRTLGP